MEILTDIIKKKIKDHCLLDISNESCGIILKSGEVIPCKNQASDSNVHFIITAKDIKKAQKIGDIDAVYHSHIKEKEEGEDGLSHEDEVVSEYFNIKYILYSIPTDKFFSFEPSGKPVEYLNRPYVRNLIDENRLIQDYYQRELNIEINNIEIKNPENFLIKNEFTEVPNPQKHDILLIDKEEKAHKRALAIYLENNKIMLHPEFTPSVIMSYNYGLKCWTKKIFRHKKMM